MVKKPAFNDKFERHFCHKVNMASKDKNARLAISTTIAIIPPSPGASLVKCSFTKNAKHFVFEDQGENIEVIQMGSRLLASVR